MNDVERYFQATMVGLDEANPDRPCRMGVLSERGQKYLKHPAKKGVQVGWYSTNVAIWEFTPEFVQECFDASNSGRNALTDYMTMIDNRMHPRM